MPIAWTSRWRGIVNPHFGPSDSPNSCVARAPHWTFFPASCAHSRGRSSEPTVHNSSRTRPSDWPQAVCGTPAGVTNGDPCRRLRVTSRARRSSAYKSRTCTSSQRRRQPVNDITSVGNEVPVGPRLLCRCDSGQRGINQHDTRITPADPPETARSPTASAASGFVRRPCHVLRLG